MAGPTASGGTPQAPLAADVELAAKLARGVARQADFCVAIELLAQSSIASERKTRL